jgi:hypothetical protein
MNEVKELTKKEKLKILLRLYADYKNGSRRGYLGFDIVERAVELGYITRSMNEWQRPHTAQMLIPEVQRLKVDILNAWLGEYGLNATKCMKYFAKLIEIINEND